MNWLDFKEDQWRRLSGEFGAVDPKQRAMILGLAYDFFVRFHHPLTITCLIHTIRENDRAGGRPNCTHLPKDKRATDLRNRTLNEKERQWIKDYIYMVWGQMFHVKLASDHIHTNVNKRWKTVETVALLGG